MRYFLGVDGGGSKTLAILVDETGKKIGIGTSGSIDILNETEQKFKDHLFQAVNMALKAGKLNLDDVDMSCFGVPIVGDVYGIEKKIKPLIEKLRIGRYVLVNDVRVALEGALPENPGAVLLAGTGSMVMAKDKNGNIFRVDGWGEHVGDLGSGYHIGQMVLREAFKEYDGRSEYTPLLDMVKEFVSVSDLREILVRCKGENVRSYIAGFSRVACQATQMNIKKAREILDNAVDELLRSVNAIVKRFNTQTPIFLSTAGGLFNCDYIRENFENSVVKNSNVKLVKRKFEPHMGAVIMAAKEVLKEREMENFYAGLKLGG